ncbi:LytR family transcriptional regulator [Streptomyces sp. 3MP-14]|uniref:LytR family transcriptional regulator n=1 Tax=Streptomyces mimosae TaxID=2586635 RepID=A0A5N6A8G9_9ACTN|nr:MULTISPECIES: LCP family protein [Streptomyces]KAB8164532.1 LytR family transcriptional regulator [Streptomyces mimosae]KAB8175448.1 LytR family transcriptional regulator [Streptomyces sp. 3MP-14]
MVPPSGEGPAAVSGQEEPPARPTPLLRRRLVRVTLITTLALALLLGVGGTVLYLKLDGNISHIDIEGALGEDRPEDSDNGSLDLLVLGSDTRSGQNGGYGGDDPDGEARSDTAMIVHVNEEHDAATVVSIPRDTMVPRPECERIDGGGTAPAADRTMFNEAYGIGGPVCAVKTVEALTGLRMDHYLEVDFAGFAELVDTLGGVEVTTTQPIEDSDSHLRLAAGTHTLSGRESLALVRTRKAVGDGSDLSRIQLQHSFLQALMGQIDGVDLFGDPRRLYDLADTATSALTTDSDLASVSKLVSLARTLRDVKPDAIQMVTLPVGYDPEDPNRVAPLREQSRQVWAALRDDRPVPRSAIRDSAAEEGGGDDLIIQG